MEDDYEIRYCRKGHALVSGGAAPDRCIKCGSEFEVKCAACDKAAYKTRVGILTSYAGDRVRPPPPRPERCPHCGARLPWSHWYTDVLATLRRACGHGWSEFKTLDLAKVTFLIVVGLVVLMLVGKITIPQLVELIKVIKE